MYFVTASSHSTARRGFDVLGPPRQAAYEQRQHLTHVATIYQNKVSDFLSGYYDANLEPKSPVKLRMHVRACNGNFAESLSRNGHTRVFRTVLGEEDDQYRRTCANEDGVYDWIKAIYRDLRGSELPGTVNPAVLENLFSQQTVKWEEIAGDYLSATGDSVFAFNKVVWLIFVVDNDMRNLSAAREERVLARFKTIGLADGESRGINLKALTKAAHLSNEEQAVNDIQDILKAYCKVALKRFMDNAVVAVVERHLLGSSEFGASFTPESVGSVTDEDLDSISAESYSTSHARMELKDKMCRFKEALKITRDVWLLLAGLFWLFNPECGFLLHERFPTFTTQMRELLRVSVADLWEV